MSFGWHRAEVVGALVSVLLIWVVTGILVSVAAQRLVTGDTEVEPGVMLVTSGVSGVQLLCNLTPLITTPQVGVLVNLVMGASLHQHGHTHQGGDTEAGHSGQAENLNVKAAFIHVIGDFIQSVGREV